MLARLTRIVYAIVLSISAVALGAMMLLIVADVSLRYLFNMPIYGSVELTRYMLAVVVFGGLSLVTLDRGHIEVTLFEPVLLRHVPRSYRFVTEAANLAGMVFVTCVMVRDAFFLAQAGQRSLMLNLPVDWVWGGIAVLGVGGIVLGLGRLAAKDTRPAP
ncbi:MAG TPA: TRAP transporter small permease subunit [Gammaproteobacteria bacterium]|nr:TRAP transporter small permease subunit [Gammaproteobacteria bacterium]